MGKSEPAKGGDEHSIVIRMKEAQDYLSASFRSVWKNRLQSFSPQPTKEIIKQLMMWPLAMMLAVAATACFLVRKSGLALWWDKLLAEPISAFVMLLVLTVLVAVVSAGFLRWWEPENTVVISPFELNATPPKEMPITGKIAADILKDEVKNILDNARLHVVTTVQDEPRSSTQSPKGPQAARSVEIEESPEISAVGIEVEGISLEKVVGLFDSIRQDQRHIEGDVIFNLTSDEDAPRIRLVNNESTTNKCGLTLRARISKIGSWQTVLHHCDEPGLRTAAHELAEEVITDLSPPTIALYLLNQERSKEALTILRRHAAEEPDNVQNVVDLASALERSGDTLMAIVEYREALKLEPQYPAQVHYRLGAALDNDGQWGEAQAEYGKAIQLDDGFAPAHYGLANLLDRDKVSDQALTEYETAVRVRGDDAQAHDFYGQALDRRWKIDESIAQYREAVRLLPSEGQFHLDLGVELEKQGNLDGAITEYRQSAYLSPKNPWAHTDLGYVLANNGEVDEAVQEHLLAIKLSRDGKKELAEAHNNLGVAYDAKGDYDAAISEYGKAIDIKSQAFYAWGNRGLDYLRKGDRAKFDNDLKSSVEKADPADRVLALTRFGDELRNIGDFRKALDLYQSALNQSDNGDPDAYVGLGYSLMETGDWNGALGAFHKAEDLRDDSTAHDGIGAVLESAGRRNAALKEYEVAAKLGPADPYAMRALASQLAEHGDYENAKRYRTNAFAIYDNAERKAPNDIWAAINLANILSDFGRDPEANKYLLGALQLGLEPPELHNTNGVVLDEWYRYDDHVAGWDGQGQAIFQYQIATRSSPPLYREASENLGYSLELEGRHKEALQVYQSIVDAVHDDVSAHLGLGQVYEDVHQFVDAIREYNLAIELNRSVHDGEGNYDDFPAGHSSLCSALDGAGDYDQAIRECTLSLEEEPHDAETELKLANAYRHKSRGCKYYLRYWFSREAGNEYQASLRDALAAQDYKETAELLVIAGRALTGIGNYQSASGYLDAALRWKPAYPLAHYYLGQALSEWGYAEEARQHFAAAARCGPGLNSLDC